MAKSTARPNSAAEGTRPKPNSSIYSNYACRIAGNAECIREAKEHLNDFIKMLTHTHKHTHIYTHVWLLSDVNVNM